MNLLRVVLDRVTLSGRIERSFEPTQDFLSICRIVVVEVNLARLLVQLFRSQVNIDRSVTSMICSRFGSPLPSALVRSEGER